MWGKEIIVRTIKAKDGGDSKGKYGRWLAEIYLDGEDVNELMVSSGNAVRKDY